jgi:hypothetical protein
MWRRLAGAERASVRTLPPRYCRPTRRANSAPDWRRRGRNRLARFIIHPPALPLVRASSAANEPGYETGLTDAVIAVPRDRRASRHRFTNDSLEAGQPRLADEIDSISMLTAVSWFRSELAHVSAFHVIRPRGPPNMMVMNGMTSAVCAELPVTSD